MSGQWVSLRCFDGVSIIAGHCLCGLPPVSRCCGLYVGCVLASISYYLAQIGMMLACQLCFGVVVACQWHGVGDVLAPTRGVSVLFVPLCLRRVWVGMSL
jgi:hypothetical protein